MFSLTIINCGKVVWRAYYSIQKNQSQLEVYTIDRNWRFDDDSIKKDHEEENDVYLSEYRFSRMLIKWKKRRVA